MHGVLSGWISSAENSVTRLAPVRPCICNRVHDLHIVFVLLYSACRSVTVLSCMCTSFDLLRMCLRVVI